MKLHTAPGDAPGGRPLFESEGWRQLTVLASAVLIATLLLGQQLTNLYYQFDIIGIGKSDITKYSLWGVISYFWDSDAKGLSIAGRNIYGVQGAHLNPLGGLASSYAPPYRV
jgi:hypothetical protein